MIKAAFWYDRPQEYSGGLNYCPSVDPDVDEERRRTQVRVEERTLEFARGYTDVIVALYGRNRHRAPD
ncbi:MAG: hypothetical protein ACRD3Q_07745 [Terriglobales bacterium]